MCVGENFSEVERLSDCLLLSSFHPRISAEHGPGYGLATKLPRIVPRQGSNCVESPEVICSRKWINIRRGKWNCIIPCPIWSRKRRKRLLVSNRTIFYLASSLRWRDRLGACNPCKGYTEVELANPSHDQLLRRSGLILSPPLLCSCSANLVFCHTL